MGVRCHRPAKQLPAEKMREAVKLIVFAERRRTKRTKRRRRRQSFIYFFFKIKGNLEFGFGIKMENEVIIKSRNTMGNE